MVWFYFYRQMVSFSIIVSLWCSAYRVLHWLVFIFCEDQRNILVNTVYVLCKFHTVCLHSIMYYLLIQWPVWELSTVSFWYCLYEWVASCRIYTSKVFLVFPQPVLCFAYLQWFVMLCVVYHLPKIQKIMSQVFILVHFNLILEL